MKKGNSRDDDLEMRPEYDFSNGVRGKYVEGVRQRSKAVVYALSGSTGRSKRMKTVRREGTLEQEFRKSGFRAAFEVELATLEVSEFIARGMAEKAVSVRALARLASVSPTIVQGIKSGKRNNIEYATVRALAVALGYRITFTRMSPE
jgi:hypothetical protein